MNNIITKVEIIGTLYQLIPDLFEISITTLKHYYAEY